MLGASIRLVLFGGGGGGELGVGKGEFVVETLYPLSVPCLVWLLCGWR